MNTSREDDTDSSAPLTGQHSRALYTPLQIDDSEMELEAMGFVPVMNRAYSSREVRSDVASEDALPPTAIRTIWRSDLRTGTAFLLVFGVLAGVSLIAVALRQAIGHRTDNLHGAVDLNWEPGEGACVPYGGHVHPNGFKCCSGKCVQGNTNYCGASNCQDQDPQSMAISVLNCCGNTSFLSVCGKGNLNTASRAPCRLPPKYKIATGTLLPRRTFTTLTTTTITTTITTETTTILVRDYHTTPAEVVIPVGPCREPTSTCATTYYGISDAHSEVCCDRACGEHCGRSDCAKGMGGEAMCCNSFIKTHSVHCADAGISPCILEPICPAFTSTAAPTAAPSTTARWTTLPTDN